MSKRNDPLVTAVNPDRVFYAAGVLLRAEDFLAEQTYHRGGLARSLRHIAGPGTVTGLKVFHRPSLAPDADPLFPKGREETIEVSPGIAVDRLGRLIEVRRQSCVRIHKWFGEQDQEVLKPAFKAGANSFMRLDVFLRFAECERGKTPALAAGPFDALDAIQPARLRDGYEFSLIIRPEDNPPTPLDPWDSVLPASGGGTLDTVKDKILDSTLTRQPAELVEYVPNQDTSSVYLARLTLTVDRANVNAPITRVPDVADINNHDRMFVYPLGAIARWVGL
jgi:hypothetical protein